MSWQWWLVLVISLVAFAVALHNRASIAALKVRMEERSAHHEAPAPHEDAPRRSGVAVVYNPVKIPDFSQMQDAVRQASHAAGYGEPTWYETTVEEPGAKQTREALETNPAVVVVAGGDGTVREVAGALTGSGVPMGILPMGTGNLLARNLNLPLVSPLSELATIAVAGRQRRMDVGRISSDEPTPQGKQQIEELGGEAFVGSVPFVVIAGMGYDADVMNDADADLKKTVGWVAYVVSGVKHLARERMRATITAGEGSMPVEVEARSILFGNCARLPAGIVLAPDARIDDGWLDVMVVDTKGGLIGWGDLIRRVSLRSLGVRKTLLPEAGSIGLRRMREARVTTQVPELVEVDGDTLGYSSEVSVCLEQRALIVHVN